MGRPVTVSTTGEVFTRRWVVDMMLDLAGYQGDVSGIRVVEPSVGSGAFFGPMVERLVASSSDWESLRPSLRGFDIVPEHVEACKRLTVSILRSAGCPIADELADEWLRVEDFLLAEISEVDLVIGNPPYIRIENIDPQRLAYYRHVCPTMRGRADIFVGFFERGLDVLAEGGRLAYICADRWMRNGYGRSLRAKVIREFSVDDVVVLHDADCFEHEVSAYPAIVSIRRSPQGPTNVAQTSETFGEGASKAYLAWRESDSIGYSNDDVRAARAAHWHTTDAVWPDGDPEELAWLAQLDHLPLIEQASVKLGIGIATGADKVYITRGTPDVELDRLVPMVTPGAIKSSTFTFTGEQLVSPWEGRRLVSMDDYPRLLDYYESHRERLRGRNIARRASSWWRTIDSFNPELLTRDLLVMQDLKKHAHPVRVPAGFYPHHGLTWFHSDSWDLDVLGGLLLSDAVERQVAAHCVRMRGGTLRFQPTVMRMVRLPLPDSIPSRISDRLAKAFRAHNRDEANAAAAELYPSR